MSIGNPDIGYCPACGKGILEPAEICHRDRTPTQCAYPCDMKASDCGFYQEGVYCSKCGYIGFDE